MSEVKFNFLNYRPILEDEVNDGLVQAENVVHEVEGYKEINLRTASAFSTAIAAGGNTVEVVVAKSVGSQGDVFAAWIHGDTLHVGVNGVTSTSVTTGYPLSFATVGTGSTSSANRHIWAFDVCEAYGKVFFVAEARQTIATPAGTETLTHAGYMDFE